MDSEVWISEFDREYMFVYRAHCHWKWNEPPGEPFEDWLERNYNCYTTSSVSSNGPIVIFLTPADKTLFILRWS